MHQPRSLAVSVAKRIFFRSDIRLHSFPSIYNLLENWQSALLEQAKTSFYATLGQKIEKIRKNSYQSSAWCTCCPKCSPSFSVNRSFSSEPFSPECSAFYLENIFEYFSQWEQHSVLWIDASYLNTLRPTYALDLNPASSENVLYHIRCLRWAPVSTDYVSTSRFISRTKLNSLFFYQLTYCLDFLCFWEVPLHIGKFCAPMRRVSYSAHSVRTVYDRYAKFSECGSKAIFGYLHFRFLPHSELQLLQRWQRPQPQNATRHIKP